MQHTTASIAKALGCTTQAVNKYRRKVEQQLGETIGSPDPKDGRRVIFSDAERDLIFEQAPSIPVTTGTDAQVFQAEVVEGDDRVDVEEPTARPLALRNASLPAIAQRRADLSAVREETANLQRHGDFALNRADNLLSGFVKFRTAQLLTNIDQTFATLEANLKGDIAATVAEGMQPGKPASEKQSA